MLYCNLIIVVYEAISRIWLVSHWGIISTIQAPTHTLAEHVASLLEHLDNSLLHVKNSEDFSAHWTFWVNLEEISVSSDVTSLFSRIPFMDAFNLLS